MIPWLWTNISDLTITPEIKDQDPKGKLIKSATFQIMLDGTAGSFTSSFQGNVQQNKNTLRRDSE